jgi:hypothetical protein
LFQTTKRFVHGQVVRSGFAGVVIGPPIMVIDSGVVSPRVAIREMAANTGTVGWLYADDVAIALYALEVADEFCT